MSKYQLDLTPEEGVKRWAPDNPCPICGGYPDLARGTGQRCHGFLTPDKRFAHCSRPESAGGLPETDWLTYKHSLTRLCQCGQDHREEFREPRDIVSGVLPGADSSPEKKLLPLQRKLGVIVATYDYTDAFGQLVRKVFRHAEPKGFTQKIVSPADVLYKLPELLASDIAHWVIVCEGEKSVEILRGLGLISTCSPEGAGHFRPAHAEFLRKRKVAILPDHDAAGQKHAKKVSDSLQGIAKTVKIVELPGLQEGEDVFDWVQRGGTRDKLLEFIEAADSEERFKPIDVGAIIKAGVPPRAFLIPEFIYRDKGMILHGESGSGKTLIALAICSELMRKGHRVFYVDEENGSDEIAKRLIGLGMSDSVISQQFLYFSMSEPQLREAPILLDAIVSFNPSWGVFDSGADFYAAAGIEENDNISMVRWFKAFLQPLARVHKIGSMLLEHENAEGNGQRARGATSKKQKTDASWHIQVIKSFDQHAMGEVEFQRTKDRFGALPMRRRAQIGGDGQGNISWHLYQAPLSPSQQVVQGNNQKVQYWWKTIEAVLQQGGWNSAQKGLTQNALIGALPSGLGLNAKIQMCQDCADSPLAPKVHRQLSNKQKMIYWVDP